MKRLGFCGLAIFATLSLDASALADIKPSRSECIIGYHLDWSEVAADRRDVANSIALNNRTERIEPLAAMRLTPEQSALYLMFRSDCQMKAEMASELIEIWRKNGLDLPRFERIEGPMLPSAETIDVRGPYWRDGEPEGPYWRDNNPGGPHWRNGQPDGVPLPDLQPKGKSI